MTAAQPLVSVILPTHNRAELLRRSMRSVLGQTYANLELIVVDDASTDHTPEVVRGFDDPRVRYIRFDQNRRAAAARNAAIREARGELFAFQDDDDEWLPQKLERQVAELAKASPEVGLHICGFRRVDQSGEEHFGGAKHLAQIDFDHLPYWERDFSLMSTPNWLLRRSALERAGPFDERLKSLDDWELAIRILDGCRFVHLDEALWIQYRQRPREGGMAMNPQLILNDYQLLVEKYGKRWKRSTLSRYCVEIGLLLLATGQGAGARGWFWRAVRLQPRPKPIVLFLASLGGAWLVNAVVWLWRRLLRLRWQLVNARLAHG